MDIRQGGLFLFINLRRNRVKLMYWDRDGIAIWQKRLEKGTLQHPQPRDDAKYLLIDDSELHLLLVGIELSSVKRRKRYVAPELPTKGTQWDCWALTMARQDQVQKAREWTQRPKRFHSSGLLCCVESVCVRDKFTAGVFGCVFVGQG